MNDIPLVLNELYFDILKMQWYETRYFIGKAHPVSTWRWAICPINRLLIRPGFFMKKRILQKRAAQKSRVIGYNEYYCIGKSKGMVGSDYILLSKQNDKWMIEQVLWEGPLDNN